MRTTRPLSAGRPSSHHAVPPASHGVLREVPARATISAEIGDDHVPWAATVRSLS
jgi:hypothetical protein